MTIEELAMKLATAKREEAECKSRRIAIEEQFTEAVLAETKLPESGSKTITVAAGLKATIKRGWNYKVDVDAIRAIDIADDAKPLKLVPAKPAGFAFDKKEYERILKDSPGVAAKLAECVTATPAKISVSLKIG